MWVPARLNDRHGPLAEYFWFQDRPLTRAVTVTNDWTRLFFGQDSLAHAAEQGQDAFVALVADSGTCSSGSVSSFGGLTCTGSPEPISVQAPARTTTFGTTSCLWSCRQPSEHHCGTTESPSRAREDCLLKPKSSIALLEPLMCSGPCGSCASSTITELFSPRVPIEFTHE